MSFLCRAEQLLLCGGDQKSALHTRSFVPPSAGAEASRVRLGGLGFDWLMVLLSAVFVVGAYLDGWAHNNDKVDQSFFTPWHAFFYGGFAVVALTLVGAVLLNRSRGYTLADVIPSGYRTSLAGLFVFAAGGVGYLASHTAFGIEEDIEALFSPTHLLLGVGLALIVTGPLRAGWNGKEQAISWRRLAPALLSFSLFLSVLTFFLFFCHPVTQVVAGRFHRHYNNDIGIVAGMLGLVVISGLLTGAALFLLRRWHYLPFGMLTLLWGLNTLGMTIIDYEHRDQLWLGGALIGAAILCDLLLVWLRLATDRPDRLRLFAFLAPVLLTGSYFAALMATEGTSWSIHLWSGAVVLTGIVGLLLSYLIAPPGIPIDDGMMYHPIIPSSAVDPLQTMENAGRSRALLAKLMLNGDVADRPVVVLAGRGNNGGGGLVAARYLLNWGAWVQLLLTHRPEEDAGVAAHQLSILQAMDAPLAWAEEG